MKSSIPDETVLSVYVTSRGFAFVLFEGPESPFDWGVREFVNPYRNEKSREAVAQLMEQYQPGVLVIEGLSDDPYHRTERVRRLYQSLARVAEKHVIDVHRVSRAAVRSSFHSLGARTKHDIAQAIAKRIPAFAIRIPPVRKPWMSQDSRQSLFDAVALGLVFYARPN